MIWRRLKIIIWCPGNVWATLTHRQVVQIGTHGWLKYHNFDRKSFLHPATLPVVSPRSQKTQPTSSGSLLTQNSAPIAKHTFKRTKAVITCAAPKLVQLSTARMHSYQTLVPQIPDRSHYYRILFYFSANMISVGSAWKLGKNTAQWLEAILGKIKFYLFNMYLYFKIIFNIF